MSDPQVGDWWLAGEEWRPHFELARSTVSVRGLAALTPGRWYLNARVVQSGAVVYTLRVDQHVRDIKVATFVLEYLPLERRQQRPPRPVHTHGQVVPIRGRHVAPELTWRSRVLVEDGLPRPIPEPLWPLYFSREELCDDETHP